MKTCTAHDFSTLSQRTVDEKTGFVTAPGTIAVGGNIQTYLASELDLPGVPPNTKINLYRPVDEVAKAVPSYEGASLTYPHPKGKLLTAANWLENACGDTSGVHMVGDQMQATLTFKAKRAIDALMAGCDGLSTGYTFDFDDSIKETPDGKPVDGYMRNIRANHTALVPRGRGGADCVVADSETRKDKHMATRTVRIGKSKTPLEFEEPAASMVETLAADHAQLVVDLEKVTNDLATALESGKLAIATKDAEIVELKSAQKAAIDAEKVALDHAGIIVEAGILAPDVKPAGKPSSTLRREALAVACKGDAAIRLAVDAALCGEALDKAGDDRLGSAFSVALAVKRQKKVEPVNASATDSDFTRALLTAGDDKTANDADVSKGDGSDLHGYEKYRFNLCHPKRAQA
jgi:hypothetical protein